MRRPDPADLDCTGHDGIGPRGRLWIPSGEPTAVALLVHGLKDHSGRYAGLAAALTDSGVAVIAFDLRGHGRSGGDRAWVRNFREYGSDLDVELQTVRSRYPDPPLVLFGHSLGGAIAARYALDHPERVSSLVLSAPALRPPPGTNAAASGVVRLLGVIAPHTRVFKPDLNGFSRDRSVVEAILRDPLVDSRPVPARTAAELLRTMASIRTDAPKLAVRLLALHGTADRITDLRGTSEFVDRVSSSDRRLVRVPGAYHDLFHEPESSDLRRELVEFVAARPSTGPPG
ncbi:MAG: lysophospholipase [Thermoplasmata archaeon]|nr:lysophospholipase [Thermoplasmata archaeon]